MIAGAPRLGTGRATHALGPNGWPTIAHASPAAAARLQTLAVGTILAGLFYNALLAWANAHGLSVGMPVVVASEALVLLAATWVIIASGRHPLDTVPALVFGFFLLSALAVSLASGQLFIDMARNGAIIALFLMLGARLDERALKSAFLWATGLVGAVIVLELLAVEAYAALFRPAAYYEQTRGMSPFELNELGLFRNALGFEDRFSIIKLADHRVSSLFLEQVSLANFSSVLVLFLVAMWERIKRPERVLYVAVVVLILLANNSRTALALMALAPFCYWLAPRLGRYASLMVMPLVLAAATVFASMTPATNGDDLAGRVGMTIRSLGELDLATLLGAKAPLAVNFADSGYTYLIHATSVFGLVFVWLLASTILPNRTAPQMRASLFLAMFLFVNLLIGGNAVFTIKIGALLWALIGFLRGETDPAPAAASLPRRHPVRRQPR
ncbi:MAG: hypothetical protein ABW194_09385 [Novosphingobium sp.]